MRLHRSVEWKTLAILLVCLTITQRAVGDETADAKQRLLEKEAASAADLRKQNQKLREQIASLNDQIVALKDSLSDEVKAGDAAAQKLSVAQAELAKLREEAAGAKRQAQSVAEKLRSPDGERHRVGSSKPSELTAIGGGYAVKNLSFRQSRDDALAMGEITNVGQSSDEAARFTLSAYGADGKLLGQGNFYVMNITPDETRTFDCYVDGVDPADIVEFKVQCDQGNRSRRPVRR